MTLPEPVLQRVNFLEQFHRATYYTDTARPPQPEPQQRPKHRLFDKHPRVELPTRLIGVDIVATVSLLAHRPEAVPESELNPPHDLKTLATWLFMAYGLTHKIEQDGRVVQLHSAPSAGSTFPCELYVAAFAVEGLEPGLYHFSAREFALRRLRGGDEAFVGMAHTVGSADVLRQAPAALLVSTVFCRSAWRFGDRGYRAALLDAGHLIENLMIASGGLGIATLITLHPDANAARQLMGIADPNDFATAEAAQALVVWSNPSANAYAPQNERVHLTPIERSPLAERIEAHPTILRAHEACVAPQGLLRQVAPPLTELSPLPEQVQTFERPPDDEPHGGEGLSKLLMHRRSARAFHRMPISREHLLWLNLVGFRGSAYWPLHPADSHAALVRPFWLMNAVRGMDAGIWYFDVHSNTWATLARGEARMEAAYLCLEQQFAADAAAICFTAANLHLLMHSAGPDLYRMAHLEAGIVNHRIQLAASALTLGACGIGEFFDEDVRKFLGLAQTRWQILYATAIGVPFDEEHPSSSPEQSTATAEGEERDEWRD